MQKFQGWSIVPPVRRQSLVAGVVLTAAFVTLVALPGVAGSETPSAVRPVSAEAFQKVRPPASADGSPLAARPPDIGYESAGHIDDTAALIEPGETMPPTERSVAPLPTPLLMALSAPASSPTPAAKPAMPASTPKPVVKSKAVVTPSA